MHGPAGAGGVHRRTGPDEVDHRRRRRVALALGAVLYVSYAFFYQGSGANQNARLDLARAVTEHGSLRIDAYAQNTGDKARFDGHYYADKAPGQPVLVVATVAATRPFLAVTGTPVGTRQATHVMMYVSAVLTSALPAAVTGVALFWVLVGLGASTTAAAVSVVAFGLATPMWAYATLLWSHPLSTAGLFLAFAACFARNRLDPADARGRTAWAVGIGLAGGWAAITDFPAGPAFVIVAVLVLVTAAPGERRLRLVGGLAAGAALPIAVLALYNTLAFGSPFHLGYESTVGFDRLREGIVGITYPRRDVALALLTDRHRGLLPLAPQLVAAPVGLALLATRGRTRPYAIAAGAVVVYFLLFNSSYAYWTGGRTVGPRFLAPALPFLCLGLATLWDRARRLGRTTIAAVTLVAATSMLAVVATNVQPHTHATVLVDIVWPALRHNAVAVGPEPYHAMADQGVAAWASTSDASNLGQAIGLTGLASLVPLVVAWLTIGAVWLRAERRA